MRWCVCLVLRRRGGVAGGGEGEAALGAERVVVAVEGVFEDLFFLSLFCFGCFNLVCIACILTLVSSTKVGSIDSYLHHAYIKSILRPLLICFLLLLHIYLHILMALGWVARAGGLKGEDMGFRGWLGWVLEWTGLGCFCLFSFWLQVA